MGRLDKGGSAGVRVRIEFSSGIEMTFDVSDEVLQGLEDLVEQGLDGTELCQAWLGAAMPRDAPVLMRVCGVRADGARVDLRVDCAGQNGCVSIARSIARSTRCA